MSKGLRCSVTHNFQALSRCLFLPRAVLSFLHSIWAFPPPCLSLWNSVTTPLSFKLQFLRPPLQKPSPEAVSFLPEPLFTVVQPEPVLLMRCKEQPRLYRVGFGAVDITEGPNYVSRAFVRDHHISQHFH